MIYLLMRRTLGALLMVAGALTIPPCVTTARGCEHTRPVPGQWLTNRWRKR